MSSEATRKANVKFMAHLITSVPFKRCTIYTAVPIIRASRTHFNTYFVIDKVDTILSVDYYIKQFLFHHCELNGVPARRLLRFQWIEDISAASGDHVGPTILLTEVTQFSNAIYLFCIERTGLYALTVHNQFRTSIWNSPIYALFAHRSLRSQTISRIFKSEI